MKKRNNLSKKTAAVLAAVTVVGAAGNLPQGIVKNVSDPAMLNAEAVSSNSVGTVTGLTSNTLSFSSIRLKWNAVNGADGYSVCMRKNGKYPEIGQVGKNSTSCTINNLPAATRENFKVRAFKIVNGKKVYGSYSANWNTATNPRQVTELKSSSVNSSTVNLNWKKIGTSYYQVYQMTWNGSWQLIGETYSNNFTIYGLTAGNTYKFRVRGCKLDDKTSKNKHYGQYSSTLSVSPTVGKVSSVSTQSLSFDKIKLDWGSVLGADGYSVCLRKNGQYPEVGSVTTTSCTIKNLPAATRENIKIRAYKIINGVKVYGPYSDNIHTATNPRKVTDVSYEVLDSRSARLSWKKVGCTNYNVYQNINGSWQIVATTTSNTYTAGNLGADKDYKFKIAACKIDDKNVFHYGEYSDEFTFHTKADPNYMDKVTGLKSKTLSTSSIKLSWNALPTADGYSVCMRKNGQYPEIGDTTGTEFTVNNLPAATRENFKVRAYKIINGTKVYGEYSDNWNTATNPRQITGLKATEIKGNTVKLTWNKVGTTNYKVYQYIMNKWELIATVQYNDCLVINLKPNNTYRFKVRACKVDDKPSSNFHYGKYSDEIAVTTLNDFSQVPVKHADGAYYIGDTLIVNKSYPLPVNYNPGGLTAQTQTAFNNMRNAAAKDGISLWVASGFRSYYTQQYLYNNYVARDGKAAADRYSARPGYSEHQTGLAIDVNGSSSYFDGSREAKWLEQHCADYGFIIRYPRNKEYITGYMYESWHVRYVGKDLAKTLTKNGETIEEHFHIISKYTN